MHLGRRRDRRTQNENQPFPASAGARPVFARPRGAAYSSSFVPFSIPTGALTVRRASPLAVLAFCSAPDRHRRSAPEEGTAPPTPAQLAAMERGAPAGRRHLGGRQGPGQAGRAATCSNSGKSPTSCIAIGPDVVPFLTSELELMDADTFHLCAYSLGRLGGPEADEGAAQGDSRRRLPVEDDSGKRASGTRSTAWPCSGSRTCVELMLKRRSVRIRRGDDLLDMPLTASSAEMIGPRCPAPRQSSSTHSAPTPQPSPNLEETRPCARARPRCRRSIPSSSLS